MARFPYDFFLQPTVDVAQGLLGATICTVSRGVLTAGTIVETEAYHGTIDPACHCYRRRTARNEVMFAAGGHSYVYFIYGMHFCFNVVTEAAETGAAVLIRAIEPLDGLPAMQRRRSMNSTRRELTNGPGKLCQALGIRAGHSGENLIDSPKIWLESGRTVARDTVGRSSRIGISQARELEWRFFLKNNRWVSGPRKN